MVVGGELSQVQVIEGKFRRICKRFSNLECLLFIKLRDMLSISTKVFIKFVVGKYAENHLRGKYKIANMLLCEALLVHSPK